MLGEILLKEEVITQEQLGQALDYQKENPKVRLGAAFVKLDLMDMKTLVGALAKQNTQAAEFEIPTKEVSPKVSQALKLGELLVKEKAVSPEQLKKAVEFQQQNPGTLFGNALIDLGFASEETIITALQMQKDSSVKVSVPEEQGRVAMKLGETLLMQNAITEVQLRNALDYQKGYPGMMLGQALTNMRYINKKMLSEAIRMMRQVADPA